LRNQIKQKLMILDIDILLIASFLPTEKNLICNHLTLFHPKKEEVFMLNRRSFSLLRLATLSLTILLVLGSMSNSFGQVENPKVKEIGLSILNSDQDGPAARAIDVPILALGAVTGGTVKANFGVDADDYADTTQFDGMGVGTGTDDWFDRKTGGSYTGLGVIDTSGGGAFRALLLSAGDAVDRNKTFVRRMSYPFDTVVNGRRWIDAVYARDNFTAGNAADSTAFAGGASKNGDNPRTWGLGPDGIQTKNDLIDTWAHIRREGALLTDSLWLFCGATTLSSDGNHHVDYEFFQNNIQSNGTALTGLGPDSGHTAWQASGGVITVAGDLIMSVDFTNGGTTPTASVRLWVKLGPTATGTPYDTAAIRAALGIPFTGVVDQGVKASPFGYAEIQIPAGAFFARVNGV
jgi:hypothetical protein